MVFNLAKSQNNTSKENRESYRKQINKETKTFDAVVRNTTVIKRRGLNDK